MRLLSILLIASLITPASKPSPALAGIAHVAFRVTNVAKSRDFYQKLGFEQSFEFNDPGKPPVSYMKVNDRQFIELYQRADDSQPLGLMHVCYEAADIEAVQRDYVQRDVKAPEPKKGSLASRVPAASPLIDHAATTLEESRLHVDCCLHAGTGHRRHHRNLQRGEPNIVRATALPIGKSHHDDLVCRRRRFASGASLRHLS